MDIGDARAGLGDIQARQAQAVHEAARWRWPWWYVAGTAALMLAVSVALDFYHDAALFTVVYCCGVALMAGAYVVGLPAAQEMTARRLRAGR
jgi:hypothetical protein